MIIVFFSMYYYCCHHKFRIFHVSLSEYWNKREQTIATRNIHKQSENISFSVSIWMAMHRNIYRVYINSSSAPVNTWTPSQLPIQEERAMIMTDCERAYVGLLASLLFSFFSHLPISRNDSVSFGVSRPLLWMPFSSFFLASLPMCPLIAFVRHKCGIVHINKQK